MWCKFLLYVVCVQIFKLSILECAFDSKKKKSKIDIDGTHINFTQHHIHNASNDDDEVKDIPGISKVTLIEIEISIEIFVSSEVNHNYIHVATCAGMCLVTSHH